VRPIVESPEGATVHRVVRRLEGGRKDPPEPHCAWYSPIHFFGHGWGIYIREGCVLSIAADIAAVVDWPQPHLSSAVIARQLLRSAFYACFLHEQFHHKVESLGLRLLVATDSDRYRPYKAKVYRPTFLTSDCVEESLANAESLRRLDERRYVQRIDPAIRAGLRKFVRAAIVAQPPGYAEGLNFVRDEDYRAGLYKLQSQILNASLTPRTPGASWAIAPNMITALADISEGIYVVLPKGAHPIFRPTWVDPGTTVSTRVLVGALTKHYGYQQVQGGKGSHVKLKKPGAPTIILAGNRPVLSPGLVKHALDAIGGYPISKLPELLAGKLPAHT
jgi:predicted RNA binding protein YcfA (HicA-like mRNA interferase family)